MYDRTRSYQKNGLMITLNVRLITNNHVGMILHLI